MTHRAWIGCSGWNYRDWRGTFYPEGLPPRRWLAHYATQFDIVEVNTTFYRLPTRETVAGWVEQTPEQFRFAVKGSRYLTHMKRLRDMGPGLERFLERLEPLIDAGRLGPLLWQLPPNFARDDERLADALDRLPPGRHAFEFRHPSWFTREVCELLAAHGAAFVQAHDARVELPQPPHPTPWRFVRLHYGAQGRDGNYGPAELATWARRIGQWRRHGDVYVFLNNDWQAFAPRNAARLRDALVHDAPTAGRLEPASLG